MEFNLKRFLFIATALIISLSIMAGCAKKENTIVVGAKDYTEQDALGNIVSILLDKNTDLDVDYKHEMGSNVIFAAIQSGDVDVYIEYTGTIYGSYLDYSDMKSADEVYEISEKEMMEKFNLRVLDQLGFNNTYCLAVTPELAEEHDLKTYSDLAKISEDLIFGGGFEILNRNDGIPNLKKEYDMKFKDEKAIDGVLRYTAIQKNETQVTEAFSTDGMLMEYELVVLEDDKNFFPPYHAVPIIRDDTAKKYPEVLEELEKLADFITDDAMRELNYKVDVEKQNPHEVALEFLKSSDLID